MKQKGAYIICATPRSGSTLLCDLLSATKVAGRPHSFFMSQFYSEWATYFGTSVTDWPSEHEFDREYLDAALQEGAGESEVFGMRLMWESVTDLCERLRVLYPNIQSDCDLFTATFGSPVYIYLSRKDTVAQAISHLKAEQSGLWHVATDGSERERIKQGHPPVYDEPALLKYVTEQESHDAAWVSWFDRQGIQPVRVLYESLSAAPQIELAKVLSAIGGNPEIAKTVGPKTAILADNESLEWATRFRTTTKH